MDYVLENSSGCSSGCESGWTMYLNNSSISPYQSQKPNGILDFEDRKRNKEADEEEEEDLSMVSDASSGPPHYYTDVDEEEEDVNLYSSHTHTNATPLLKKNSKLRKTNEFRCRKVSDQHHSLLDDTASSPVFNLSNNNFTVSKNYDSAENLLEISQGYSATHFQGKSGYYNYKSHYDFWDSSVSGNILQQNQLYQERRWL